MPTIAIIDPHKIINSFGDKHWYVHAYVIDFIKLYNTSIFLSSPLETKKFNTFVKRFKLEIPSSKVIYRSLLLNKNCDILIYFWGFQSNFIIKQRIKNIFNNFNGIKLYHIQDYQYMSSKCHAYLREMKVDFLLGYTNHSKHCNFFRKYYKSFIGRTIGIPFGYHSSFNYKKKTSERKYKAIGCGAIEKFDWKENQDYWDKTIEYYNFFSKKFKSMHEIRYMINNNKEELNDYVECRFNIKSEKYHYISDYNELFNNFLYFINDESLLNFPPIRTYEGCASGSIMICHNATSLKALGFENDKNCIMFDDYKLEDIKEKINFYNNNIHKLEKIRENSINLIKRYSHINIAKSFNKELLKRVNE